MSFVEHLLLFPVVKEFFLNRLGIEKVTYGIAMSLV